jgi:hypothetical protein
MKKPYSLVLQSSVCIPRAPELSAASRLPMTSACTPKATIFSEIGEKTQLVARFSTVAKRGSADAERDIRGFALKSYTDEGSRR